MRTSPLLISNQLPHFPTSIPKKMGAPLDNTDTSKAYNLVACRRGFPISFIFQTRSWTTNTRRFEMVIALSFHLIKSARSTYTHTHSPTAGGEIAVIRRQDLFDQRLLLTLFVPTTFIHQNEEDRSLKLPVLRCSSYSYLILPISTNAAPPLSPHANFSGSAQPSEY